MDRENIEIGVGAFMFLGLLCLAYMAINMGGVGWVDGASYSVKARFVSVSGLREGAFVELAGVRIGTVGQISVDTEDYLAVVELTIDRDIALQQDTIASVRTSGIIGDKFVKLTPGGSEEFLDSGDEIIETESSINLEELISKYIFETKD